MQQLQKLNSQVAWLLAVSVTVLLWLLILKISNVPIGFSLDALKQIPSVVTVETAIWLIFSRWGWKLPVLSGWLVRVPVIEGNWEGKIQTNWKDPQTGTSPGPIDTSLEIRQTFGSISCKMRTGEMVSESFAADFMENPGSGTVTLLYSYSSVPNASVRGRSQIHFGTAKVEIENKSSIRGQYWTDRNTSGDLELKKIN